MPSIEHRDSIDVDDYIPEKFAESEGFPGLTIRLRGEEWLDSMGQRLDPKNKDQGRRIRYFDAICGTTIIEFMIVGEMPTLWINCNQHEGDEWWVTHPGEDDHWASDPLRKLLASFFKDQGKDYLEDFLGILPDCVIVLHASPSSKEQKTRNNGWNQNVNRGYTPDLSVYGPGGLRYDEEVVAVASLMTFLVGFFGQPFAQGMFIHGEPEFMETYFYHHAHEDILQSLEEIRRVIKETFSNIALRNGIDQPGPEDPGTGFAVEDGYVYVPGDRDYDGTLEVFALLEWLILFRIFVIEIPNMEPENILLLLSIYFRFTVLSDECMIEADAVKEEFYRRWEAQKATSGADQRD